MVYQGNSLTIVEYNKIRLINLQYCVKKMASSNSLSVSVKWAGKLYTIDDFDPAATTVGDLKSAIHAKTNVLPSRQKLLNLPKFKGQGRCSMLS